MNPLNIVPQGWLTNTSGIALVFFGALFVAWNGAAQMYPDRVPPCPDMLASAAMPMIGMGLVALGLRREQSANSKKLDVLDAKVSITDPNAAAIAEAEANKPAEPLDLPELVSRAVELVALLRLRGAHAQADTVAATIPELLKEPKA